METTTNLSGTITWTPIFTNTVSFWYTNYGVTSDWRRFFRAITN